MTLRESNIDKSIDVKGKICPYPLIETREALKSLNDGQILEVITDHQPAAKATIPGLCEKKNYPFEVIDEGDFWRVLIKKSEGK